MEFHRGRVNQKFEGVYKRGDGERNGTGTVRGENSRTESEERLAIVVSPLRTAYASLRVPVPFSRYGNITATDRNARRGEGKIANGDNGV